MIMEPSTHKFAKMLPYPFRLLNLMKPGDELRNLVLESFKKNRGFKKKLIDTLLDHIHNNYEKYNEIVVNMGDYAPDGYYDKWAIYFLTKVQVPIKICGSYIEVFQSKITDLLKSLKKESSISFIFPSLDFHQISVPEKMIESYPKVNNKKRVSMVLSQGCPRRCKMCPVGVIYKRKYKYHDILQSIEKIKYYYNLGVRYISFIDDNISANLDSFIIFLRMLKKLNLKGLKFLCQEGFEVLAFLNEEFCQLIKETHWEEPRIGIENISQDFLETIGKYYTEPEIRWKVMENIEKYDIKACIFLLFAPFQSEKEIIGNIRFFSDFNVKVRVNILRNYEGTEIRRNLKTLTSIKRLKELKSMAYAASWWKQTFNVNIFRKGALKQYLKMNPHEIKITGGRMRIIGGKQDFWRNTYRWTKGLAKILEEDYGRVLITYDDENRNIRKVDIHLDGRWSHQLKITDFFEGGDKWAK